MLLFEGMLTASTRHPPVMKIFAIGFNYPQYNKEADCPLSDKERPVVFNKADSSLLKGGRPLFLPDDLGPVCYEAEVVVRICRLGKSVPARFAHRYYDAVTCGIDFTARDLLGHLAGKGLPWDLSKSFDGAAAIGEWVVLDPLTDIQDVHFHLDINGETVQRGYTRDMLQGVDCLIAYISRFFTLRTGDILFTGAPTQGGMVHENDHLVGYIEDRKVLEFNVK
jgi:2-keto-4-pentenoate hydratase/2-oxohepta-3-ene-1,7-dioic acid hydratase in catechol pathway